MTAIGKIMVVFVFLLSLIWAGLVANTWATRTNWKAEADKQNKIAKENYDGAKALAEQAKADRSASDSKVAALQANVDRLQGQLVEQREQYNKLYAAYDNKLKGDRMANTKVDELELNLKKLQDERDLLDKNLKTMEASLNAQVILTEANKIQRDEALRAAAAEKQRADLLITKLQLKEEELAAAKSGGKGNLRPLPPEDFRGTVRAYSDDIVEITPGINAGLKVGMLLTIRRTEGTKNYIGAILIDSTDPDRAVGKWVKPFSVKQPKGDDYPKAGDEVVPMKN